MRDPMPGDLIRTAEGYWGLLKWRVPGTAGTFAARLSDGQEVRLRRGDFDLMPLNYFETNEEVANFATEMSLPADPDEAPYRADGPHWAR